MSTEALDGLRVIDLTNDSGRFATKILTELGADVVRICSEGSRGHRMSTPEADALGGVLDWWYDGGKKQHHLDLSTEHGQLAYRRLAGSADLVIETEQPGRLHDLQLDHQHLSSTNPQLTQVSITPFGRTGPRSSWVTSDLVSSALGGFMSITGLPDRPLNLWGRQAYNYAGFTGAISALAAVRAARVDGQGRHLDVSIHEAITGSIENIFMQYFFDEELPGMPKLASRQGALHWLRAYDLAECRTGYTMITPTPSPEHLIEFMIDHGHSEASEWRGKDVETMLEQVDDMMDCIRDFVKQHDAMELWWAAQARHCALGGVHDIPAVAGIPQFSHRGLFAETEPGAGDAKATMPYRMVKMTGTPVALPRPPAAGQADLDALLAEWGQRADDREPPSSDERLRRPLDGVRVADFTWVLAGPFCTRMLGDLGADVIRIQNEARSTLVNRADYPYYFVWNRSKRSATLNMKHPDALAAARRIIENSDVLIENYSAGVLDAWGLDWETVREWNPRLVYVTMSGCGHDGPWQHVISYAPTVHAVCGITHLTNFSDRGDVGPGLSLNDHLAGFSAATTTLAALAARDRTGVGQKIDMAQLEIGTYAVGPALIDFMTNDRITLPEGNRDGLHDHVPNEVYRARDGFLAVSATTDAEWQRLVAVVDTLSELTSATEAQRRQRREEIGGKITTWLSTRTADKAMATLQSAGVPAGVVQDAKDLFEHDPQHAARGFWQPAQHDGFGARHVDSFPAMIDGERLAVERLAPAYLGEHNFEVWTDVAGYAFDDVADGMGSDLFS